MLLLEPAPTAFDWNFRLFDTPVRVSVWFWVLPGLFGVLLGALLGVAYAFVVAGCFLLSILVHEFGHVFAGRYFGADGYVVLNGIGGVAVGSADLGHRWQRVAVYLAGPAAQLLLAGVLWLFQAGLSAHDRLGTPNHSVFLCLAILTGINLSWPLFNLLPIWPLDGGQILREFLPAYRGPARAPWEQDADWWKGGSRGFDGRDSPRRRSFPLLYLAVGALAVGLLAVWLSRDSGSVSRDSASVSRRRQAFTELESLGVRMGWDGRDTYYGFNGSWSRITDDRLGLLALFPETDDVDLEATAVTDEGLCHVQGLHKVRTLHLARTRVTDAGLAQLGSLRGLRRLYLCRTRVTDAGLEHLHPLEDLELLSLSHTGVTDAVISHLHKAFPRLWYLYVYGTKMTDTGIAELKRARPLLTVNPTSDEEDDGCRR